MVLGQRVVHIKSFARIPFGATGIVIGIHPNTIVEASPEVIESCMCAEILLEQPHVSAALNSLRHDAEVSLLYTSCVPLRHLVPIPPYSTFGRIVDVKTGFNEFMKSIDPELDIEPAKQKTQRQSIATRYNKGAVSARVNSAAYLVQKRAPDWKFQNTFNQRRPNSQGFESFHQHQPIAIGTAAVGYNSAAESFQTNQYDNNSQPLGRPNGNSLPPILQSMLRHADRSDSNPTSSSESAGRPQFNFDSFARSFIRNQDSQ